MLEIGILVHAGQSMIAGPRQHVLPLTQTTTPLEMTGCIQGPLMIEMGVLPQVSAATAALMIMYELHTTSTGTSNSDLVPSFVLRVNASKTASPQGCSFDRFTSSTACTAFASHGQIKWDYAVRCCCWWWRFASGLSDLLQIYSPVHTQVPLGLLGVCCTALGQLMVNKFITVRQHAYVIGVRMVDVDELILV